MAPIIFDLKLNAAPNVEAFIPDFSRDYKKPETIAAKRSEWIANDWQYSTAAAVVSGIVVPSKDPTVDTVEPATLVNLLTFTDAITSGKQAVVCEHFHLKSALLLTALSRIVTNTPDVAPDLAKSIAVTSKRLYDLRRQQLDNVFPFLDGKFDERSSHVHNVIRALRLDDLSHAGLCAFAGAPNTATRLTVQWILAHRIGITQE